MVMGEILPWNRWGLVTRRVASYRKSASLNTAWPMAKGKADIKMMMMILPHSWCTQYTIHIYLLYTLYSIYTHTCIHVGLLNLTILIWTFFLFVFYFSISNWLFTIFLTILLTSLLTSMISTQQSVLHWHNWYWVNGPTSTWLETANLSQITLSKRKEKKWHLIMQSQTHYGWIKDEKAVAEQHFWLLFWWIESLNNNIHTQQS